jgi:hypothetical protein
MRNKAKHAPSVQKTAKEANANKGYAVMFASMIDPELKWADIFSFPFLNFILFNFLNFCIFHTFLDNFKIPILFLFIFILLSLFYLFYDAIKCCLASFGYHTPDYTKRFLFLLYPFPLFLPFLPLPPFPPL